MEAQNRCITLSHHIPATPQDYSGLHGAIVALLEAGRREAARSINARMTAVYWEIGRRIVEFEQGGAIVPAMEKR